ncbi:Protein PLASTID REDOX INSENSITIVE 2, chloroplastic [Linum grandiflorum]
MAATWSSKALVSSPLLKVPRALLPASSPPAVRSCSWRPSQLAGGFRAAQPYFHHPPIHRRTPTKLFCEEFEEEEDDFNYNYKFPDPIPEFADAETEKFRSYLADKLSKKEKFKDSLDEIVEICTELSADHGNLLSHGIRWSWYAAG